MGDNTRAKILDVAGEVFAEKGFATATIREICEKAGANLAAVNYYFGGKEPLYAQTLERAYACAPHGDRIDGWPPGTPPATKLTDFIRQVLTHMLVPEDEPWQSRLMTREVLNPTAMGRRLLRDHFRQRFQQLQSVLDEILPADTPEYKRHQVNFSIMGQCSLYRGLAKIMPLVIDEDELRQHYGVEELAEHVAQVSLAALGLAPPLAGPRRRDGVERDTVRETVSQTGSTFAANGQTHLAAAGTATPSVGNRVPDFSPPGETNEGLA